MKKYISLIALAFMSLSADAQIQIGSNPIAAMNKAGKISAESLATLKSSTTLFTLPFKDYERKAEFEEAIRQVWTVTPFQIISPEEIGAYSRKKGYAIFSFGGFLMQRGGSSPSASNMHLSYDLWMPEAKKNNKVEQDLFAKILIYPDNKTFFTAMDNAHRKNDDFSARMVSFLYNDAIVYNWSPGFLKGYLKVVNDFLVQKEERGPFTEFMDEKALKSLRNDTLYVPEYVNVRFNMFTGKESSDDDDVQVKEVYPYPLKVVSSEELSRLVLDRQRPVKYLVYTKSSTDKFINIYDSKDGSLLYAKYVKVSYNFKNKDLEKLAKEIR